MTTCTLDEADNFTEFPFFAQEFCRDTDMTELRYSFML